MVSKKKRTAKSKSSASLQAQTSAKTSSSPSPSASSSLAPALTPSTVSVSDSVSVSVSAQPAQALQSLQENKDVNDNNDNNNNNGSNDSNGNNEINDNNDDEHQPLLQPEQPLHSRNPHRSPTLPHQELTNNGSDHSQSQAHSHEHEHDHHDHHDHHHEHGNGHSHAPQGIVDSQSIIHTSAKSTTPLKQSLTQSYGSTQGTVVVDIEDSAHSTPLRSVSPPPIACKGVLITSETTKSKRKLIFVTILCLCFFAVEMIGGYFAKSLALMSDAFHLLSDVISFIVSLIAIWLSEQPATKRHSFGYHRAEVLAALMSVFIIWILTAFLLMEAVERIRNPQPIDGKTMCIVASIGVVLPLLWDMIMDTTMDMDMDMTTATGMDMITVMNTTMAMTILMSTAMVPLTPTPTVEININVKAATLHVIGDLISSVGVLVASIIIMIKPSWTIVDPICTFFFSILVLFTTYRLVWDSLGILMEGTPTHIDPEEIESSLLEIPGVTLVHDLHVWNLTAGKPSMAVHLQLAPTSHLTNQELTMVDYDRILAQAQNVVCGRFQIHHSTIQLETASNSSEHCRPDICSNEPLSAAAVGRGNNVV
ncbi:hypothetical protein BGZ80_006073 [Entomortierella chlamydospora]|uniref:Uncharacterized protein n=1 Tax=Entomortierella chlamydospora TaxID=101097 RepID=A0A9P6N6V5_9FUNG|nr:hypothetical protein BGZ79_009231 [Entomortierella chlamydospora]KAG0024800.1 hypothetical protein BGZ80_006073 [Entomortierella chlamydospora]